MRVPTLPAALGLGLTVVVTVAVTGAAAWAGPAVATRDPGAGVATRDPAPAAVAPSAVTTANLCAQPTTNGVMSCAAVRRTDIPSRSAVVGQPFVVPSGYGPADLASAYNLNTAGGAGATVAIVDAFSDPNAAADLAVYRTQFGLPACTVANGCLRIVNQSGATSPLPAANAAWAGEEALDLAMVSAVCPHCAILLVEANSANKADLYASVDRAVVMGARFVSNSWAGAEVASETADDVHFDHPGVVITAATGDWGTGAYYPATSRFVTAVGGTKLVRPAGGGRWTETVWSHAGSACSAYEAKPVWQTVSTSCTRRAEADVSAVADPTTGVAVYQTYGGPTGWVVYGGTSVATPVIASVYALAGTPPSTSYPAAYPYLRPVASGLFDITSGTNGFCGVPICGARVGWDGPTGLGVPNGLASFTPPTMTTVANPGTQTGAVGSPTSLTLSATGGFAPYRWSSTALPAGLSLNATTGVISGTPTASTTVAVTVTARGADDGPASTTFTWVVSPPALSVGISGTGSVPAKATYTFTAVYSGFNPGPSFDWWERFCSDWDNTNCSSWVEITGLGDTMTRTLNVDCSGLGQNSYQQMLVMTNSDGRQATGYHFVSLCGPA